MKRLRAKWVGYLISVISVAAAMGITFAIVRTNSFRPAIGYAFLIAILLSAWNGYGPGLLTCALSFFVAPYLFVSHFNPLKSDPNRVTLTVLVSLLVSRVSAVHKRSEQLLRAANEELERRVEERTAELKRSNAELEQYAYVASHDLQEPLRTINTMAGLFVKRYRGQINDPNAEELLGYIESSAKRMQSLITDLLSYSRVIAQEEEDSRSVIDLQAPLQEALGACVAEIAGSGAKVTHDPMPRIRVDATQFGQVFQNLVTNAIKYRNPALTPFIHIGAHRDGSAWTVSVADNGIGIAQDYHERIFGLFKRLHNTEIPGTGIGLAICKRIIERYGGRIWVESTPGAGSTFYFTVPDTFHPRSDPEGQDRK